MTTSELDLNHPLAVEPAPVWAGDPSVLGLPSFIVGSTALGLVLVGYVPPAAAGASLAILIAATGLGLTIAAIWAAAIGQSVVGAVFGIFAGFWLSYSMLVLGLTHNWFGIAAEDAVRTQELFLISWLAMIIMVTLVTFRLPLAFTLLFVLVDLALLLVLLATAQGSIGLQKTAGYVVFAFVLVGFYLFLSASSAATGGKPLALGRPVLR
ncbi:hypothetical protein EFK50_13960 [Nocardioides marmoriginsengisoli]|uniref:Uncharacterized protein n=1 Tax=Nocardioides marmoriginsengisoli TaxID=661483 RepID=A0A3N0CHR8_9ACTN|nr:GPR1/FUN34/YaaH family transporter [Nocardioides marmoriginsengisoli]RNL62839.1 hypothetical protein EFK50_13960 [Nocardioides marmoriginsengisoli]